MSSSKNNSRGKTNHISNSGNKIFGNTNTEYVLNANEKMVCKFYQDKYIDAISLTDKTLSDALKDKAPEDWKYGGTMRYNIMRALSLNLFMDTTNTIIAVYKIKDIGENDREVIYNIAYINIRPNNGDIYFDNENMLNKFSDVSEHGNLYINNICPVSSTMSKDGEYRSVIIYWDIITYILIKNKELNAMFNDIYEYFIDKFQDRKLLIYSYNYFPTDELKNKYSFEVDLLISKRQLKFFSISWFIFYYSFTFGTISDRINTVYQKIMFKYKHEDVDYFNLLIKKYGIVVVQYMYHIFNSNIRSTTDRGIDSFCKMKMGQKFIPISLREIQFQFDMQYRPWKEYFVNLRLTDLVVNQVTPGFAITTNWIFIKNTDKHLFDNPSQYIRMERSTHASQISNMLNQARYLTKQQIKPSHMLMYNQDMELIYNHKLKKQNNIVTSWISREFQNLYAKIDDAIIYSHLNITMSNVTFCIFSEYVGKTLYESIFITKKSTYYKHMVQNIFSESGFPIFERFIFEIAYSLLCSSSKFGIIHSDLHMHNVTLNDLFYKTYINISTKNPKVLYILGDNNEYLFDTNFYFMTIIDFSRCIINPSGINAFRHDVLHKTFDLVENMRDFEDQQAHDLTNYLFACKPEYKEYGLPLLNGMRIHFNVYFKILSILDLLMITSRFLDFFKFKKELAFTPYAGCISLMKDIYSRCDIYLTNSIDIMMKETELAVEQHGKDNWPILDIINTVFAHRNIKNLSEINPNDIVDVYNYNNELTYSLQKSTKMPPPLTNLSKNNENDSFIKNSIERRNQYEQQVEQNIKTLLIIKKRQREKNVL